MIFVVELLTHQALKERRSLEYSSEQTFNRRCFTIVPLERLEEIKTLDSTHPLRQSNSFVCQTPIIWKSSGKKALQTKLRLKDRRSGSDQLIHHHHCHQLLLDGKTALTILTSASTHLTRTLCQPVKRVEPEKHVGAILRGCGNFGIQRHLTG